MKIVSLVDAHNMIANREVLIADVRDPDSFQESHIPGAVHLSLPTIQSFSAGVQKHQPIIVYCYHGISSQSVAQHLSDAGFLEVYSLEGGFEHWKDHYSTASDS